MAGRKSRKKLTPELKKALKMFPELVREEERNFQAREKDIARFADLSRELLAGKLKKDSHALGAKQIHPWRLCPYGEHWVVTHPLTIPPTTSRPHGRTTRHNHCVKNPSGKDHLYPAEIAEIAKLHFHLLPKMPCPLTLGFKDGRKFDALIAGWTQYWNEFFKPLTPLDPDLVKALIATESSFNPNPKVSRRLQARGLMQLTAGLIA